MEQSKFESLPLEILENIFIYLPITDLLNLYHDPTLPISTVCQNPNFWIDRTILYFGLFFGSEYKSYFDLKNEKKI